MTAYNIYLFDDCCHNWFSTDSGATWREGATPGSPSVPAPDDPGKDPYGIGTLLDEWSDAQMAINDADYLTICGFDFDYNGSFGILGISLKAGQNLTYTLIDPEPGSPAFVANFNIQAPAFSGAISANAQIILTAPNYYTGSAIPVNCYPRLSTDGGATWNDVTGVPANQNWARVAFSAGATTMYLMADNSKGLADRHIFKSTDSGATWAELSGGPVYHGFNCDEAQMRLRCSADGQTVVAMNLDGNFWLSKNGGTTWANTNFATIVGVSFFGHSDCSVTPDGGTIIVSFEQKLNFLPWPAVFVSTDGGTSFNNVTANIQYPASIGPPVGGAPGTIATGCSQCNVAPDGLGMVVTFEYKDNPVTEPDGLTGYTMYVNVSTDAGATFSLKSFNADPYEHASALGLFTGIYITPYTFIPPPGPTPPPFPTPKGGYIIERLDNRIWPTVENAWCVDCGFTLEQPKPDADLQIIPVP